MMKWFDKSKLHTVAELRAEYKRLLIKHHSDNGGRVSDMQEINAEYDALYAILKEKESADDTHTNYEENERFKAVLSEIIRCFSVRVVPQILNIINNIYYFIDNSTLVLANLIWKSYPFSIFLPHK